jgi:hypothetical protein
MVWNKCWARSILDPEAFDTALFGKFPLLPLSKSHLASPAEIFGLLPLKERLLAVRARLRPFLGLGIKPKRQMHF